ncbi:hypothetical protein BJX70DRAFT_355601 [Aspergillus crustosus]
MVKTVRCVAVYRSHPIPAIPFDLDLTLQVNPPSIAYSCAPQPKIPYSTSLIRSSTPPRSSCRAANTFTLTVPNLATPVGDDRRSVGSGVSVGSGSSGSQKIISRTWQIIDCSS